MVLFNFLFSSPIFLVIDCPSDEILANYNYIWWGARSSPSQVPTALLTTALIIGLNYHLKERIPTLDGLLKVTVTPLHVPLTMERSTRFLLRKQ